MATAAHCSECGENVYVTADGACPNGHGPECLSGHYDVPDQPQMAAPEQSSESEFLRPETKSKMRFAGSTLLALFILGTLLLGCCVVSGWWLFFTNDDSGSTETTTLVTGSSDEDTAYLDEVARIEEQAGAALDALEASYPATTPEALEASAEAAGALNASYVQAQNLSPAPGREVMHDHFIETLRLMHEWGMLLAENGFQQLDDETAVQAENLLIDAETEYNLMWDAYELLEPPEE